MTDYTISLHSHTVYSARDAILKPTECAAKIKKAGATHYPVSDHGTIQGWLAVRDAAKKEGLVPVYGNELYVNDCLPLLFEMFKARDQFKKTEERHRAMIQSFKDNWQAHICEGQFQYLLRGLQGQNIASVSKTLTRRMAFSYYHFVVSAYTKEGRDNLIRLSNKGYIEGYYYKPQVTTAQVLQHAEGCIFTSACMVGPLARGIRFDPSGGYNRWYLDLWKDHWHNFYLEVQPLDLIHQRRYNEVVLKEHRRTGIPLILNQDNHHLDEGDWMAHRVMMLGQNNRPIEEIEAYYQWKGQSIAFSDLKRSLGVDSTWKVQEIIENESLPVNQEAGHHYGDVKLHWRTMDEIEKQCEVTNPELLPFFDQFRETARSLCEQIEEIPWNHEFRIPRYDSVREKVLKVCTQQLVKIGKHKDPEYLEWLRKEDKVIHACGFYDYLWTLYLWTSEVQRRGIPIGYARGSGGGCIIMYLLGIIRVNPIKYKLFFDRFLNPARLGLDPITLEKVKDIASCPDVDLDFSSIHRPVVIEIARELFGKEYVIPIGTVGKALFKTAFGDLCKVIGLKQHEFLPISKELPDDPNGKLDFDDAMEVEAFKDFIESHPKGRMVRMFLPALIGAVRSTGMHAGGICIADRPLAQTIPLVRSGSKDDAEIVTGFGESGRERALESIGYIKFDALATDTVDHMSLCARYLYRDHIDSGGEAWIGEGERFLYPEQIPFFREDDPHVMKTIFHTGDTDGVFQLEENIGKNLSQLVKPNTVEEASDVSTMIRPGCLKASASFNIRGEGNQPIIQRTSGLHLEYAARKFDPEINPPPELPQEILDILRPTHYCCIYQEQMMFLIETLSGGKVSLGEGDIYRRSIEHWGKGKEGAKEKVEEIEARVKSVSPYSPEVVDRVCEIIKGGAAYSFNKSHSLSYALCSYAQAWFKAYYPHIFYAAHITLLADKNKLTKVHKIVNNARSRGIEINSPHVKRSDYYTTYSEDGKDLYLPFVMMKGVTQTVAKKIAEIGRESENIFDFVAACIQSKEIKKNNLMAMAKSGALDSLSDDEKWATIDRLRIITMVSFAATMATSKTKRERIIEYCKEALEFNYIGSIEHERALAAELEVFGGFVNECPLDLVQNSLEKDGWTPLSQIEPKADEQQRVFFMITNIIKKIHKSGKNEGKEWFKLVCWDGYDVCELCIWNYDLDDREDRMGYRGIILKNHVYRAHVQWDGQRPCALGRRHLTPGGDTLIHTSTAYKR